VDRELELELELVDAAAAACPVGTETRVEYFIIIKPSKHDIRWLRI